MAMCVITNRKEPNKAFAQVLDKVKNQGVASGYGIDAQHNLANPQDGASPGIPPRRSRALHEQA